MPTIIETFEAAGPLWFPGLAELLATGYDAKNGRLGEPSYLHFCASTASPERTIAIGSQLCLLRNPEPTAPSALTGILSCWRDSDNAFIADALQVLEQIDGLIATLAPLVRSISRIEAEPAFDISHSDPALPYSIFVSIPPSGPTAAIRLAESILHETMHLQLSLIERELVLVTDDTVGGWSPWQARERPPQGLLHGLYVFSVLFEVLGQLEKIPDGVRDYSNATESSKTMHRHILERRQQIANEVSELPDFGASLSIYGEQLRRRCLEAVLSAV